MAHEDNVTEGRNSLTPTWLWTLTLVVIVAKSVLLLALVLGGDDLKPSLSAALTDIVFWPVFVAIPAACLSFTLLLRGRPRVWALVAANLVVSLVLAGDALYFRGFRNVLSLGLIGAVGGAGEMMDAGWSLLRPLDALYGLDLLVLLPMLYLGRLRGGEGSRPRAFVTVAVISGACIAGYGLWNQVIRYDRNRVFFGDVRRPELTMACVSPIGYHLQDAVFTAFLSRRVRLSEADRQRIAAWYEGREPLGPGPLANRYAGFNLLVIQVESLEGAVVGLRLPEEVTPTLNRLAREGLYFSKISEQVRAGSSSDAELLVNTSMYPVRLSSTFVRYADTRYISMPILLRAHGYTSFAAHPERGSCWNVARGLLGIGFDRFYDRSDFDQDEMFGDRMSDGSLLRQFAEMLGRQPQPFHAEVVTISGSSSMRSTPWESWTTRWS